MKFSIQKVESGKIQTLHPAIESRDKAKDILRDIANANIKCGLVVTPRPTLDRPCSVVIGEGKLVFLIGESS